MFGFEDLQFLIGFTAVCPPFCAPGSQELVARRGATRFLPGLEFPPMPSSLALRRLAFCSALIFPILAAPFPTAGQSPEGRRGYYSDPALHSDTIVFISEGDLWSVSVHGGAARRLTTGSGIEDQARISPDGQTVAFHANYEGPSEVYTMPIDGGLPQRRTWDGNSLPAGWAPDGRLLIATGRYSTLPGSELALIDSHGGREIVPLAEAAEGAYSSDGQTLFFTRWFKQSSETKRYKGGWAENIWSFDGKHEAVLLTARLGGHLNESDVLERARVFPLRPRWGDERLLDDSAGWRCKGREPSAFLRCLVRVARRRLRGLCIGRRPVASRSEDRPRSV